MMPPVDSTGSAIAAASEPTAPAYAERLRALCKTP